MPRAPELEEMLHQPKGGDPGVQDYLDTFAQALTAGDGEAIADLWETPAFVIAADMVRTVDDRSEVADFFGGAREQYNKLGITGTRAEIVRLDAISDRLVNVTVRWPYLDAHGRETGGETSTYTLRRGDDGDWKMRVAVMHGAEAQA
jgi:hypothetical protein